MSGATVVEARPASATGAGLKLVLTACPLCGKDEGEPVAVGDGAVHTTRDTFLAVSCPACGLVYLNPRPAPEDRWRLYPPAWFQSSDAPRHARRGPARVALRRVVRRLGPGMTTARVLEVGYGASLHLGLLRKAAPPGWVLEGMTPHEILARAARAGGFTVHDGWAHALDARRPGYDLVLLLHSLEHCDSPAEEMASVREVLRPGGRAVILTPNPDSTIGGLFRGRHWTGYDFPRHPCLFGPRALRRLAEAAGFQVERLGSLEDARAWAGSAENLLRDWGAPGWLTHTAPGLFAMGSLVSSVTSRQRQAAGPHLEAILRKPAGA